MLTQRLLRPENKEPAGGRALVPATGLVVDQNRQMMLAEAKSTELNSEISKP